MTIPDLLTSYCTSPQIITTDVVSEHTTEFPSDAAREVFVHSEKTIRIIVGVAAAGGAEGLRIQAAFDTAASLASGSKIVAAETRILLPAELTLNQTHFLEVSAMSLPEGYDFFGLWFDVVTSAFSGGFAVYAALVDGPERKNQPDA